MSKSCVYVLDTFTWWRPNTSPDVVRRSYTTPDGTNRSLAKFYTNFLMSTSSTKSSTYSSQKRSLRWTSSKRKIMAVIEVDQLEDTNNEWLSWSMSLSGLKAKNENDPKEEDDLRWKMTFHRRRPLTKMTFHGRRPSIEDDNEDDLKNKEDLHIIGRHTALDIFCFAVFLPGKLEWLSLSLS